MLNRLSLNRIGLNRIGLNRIGKSSGGSSDRPYIDPKVLDSLRGVWIMDQNTNESESRNIIKNKIADRGGNLELLNFAYKANSGYNGYPEDFTSWDANVGVELSNDGSKAKTIAGYSRLQYRYSTINKNIESFKVKISNFTKGTIHYYYRKEDGIEASLQITITKVIKSNGIIELPKSYNTVENGTGVAGGFSSNNTNIGVTIEQLPLYEGALVTDGKDDMIVSQKTVQEMLGGSNVCTVVSMIHTISSANSSYEAAYTNCIIDIDSPNNVIRNNVGAIGKTGIYGYKCSNLNTQTTNTSIINNILGDKNDYGISAIGAFSSTSKFSVIGFGNGTGLSEVAVYWTFISNKVLTTDEINQIIAYFKLDKYVTPQVIYDVKRQGLTNDTPAADWYLKDFSGNGHDMQLYNYAKTPESGINEDGGLQSDGIDDYGKAEGLPILKDYTIAADRAIVDDLVNNADGGVFTKGTDHTSGAFAFDYKDQTFSFGFGNNKAINDTKRFISYQSKYVNNGESIGAGSTVDIDPLMLAKLGSENNRYSALALYSMLLFPYSLSEFLLERQLKKYKLGTLYPDMVEWRPIVKSNVPYKNIVYTILGTSTQLVVGQHYPVSTKVRMTINTIGKVDEVSLVTINGQEAEISRLVLADFVLTSKSPQKINITIDEYIRFEDIVQPYPAIINLSQDGKNITYGDKLKVGSEITFVNHINLLPEIYGVSGGVSYNGTIISGWNTPIVVAKSMVFTNVHGWKLNTTEPHAIYSPQKLNIPNSSLKILGYVPDLTGKGNHGKLNNFAYTEDSGVAADGSIKFDGTDDHITIPTLAHGGKCVMMKVNWSNVGMLYDQRPDGGYNTFSIYTGENHPAYNARNNGSTYIDGILNTNIIPSDLVDITHNITAVNDKATDNNTVSPRLGVSFSNATFSNMSLYEFMLFPEIPSEDEIKKLNDAMGIEGGYVESPNYYWDAYGKKNTDTDRNLIADQVSKDVANALEVKNVAYNSESGYGGKGFVPFNGDWKHDESKLDFQFITNGIHVTKGKATLSNWFWTNNPAVKGAKTKYKITGVTFDRAIRFFNGLSEYQLVINKDGIYEVDGSLLVDGDGNPTGLSIGDNGWVGDCDIVIEQLTEYPNGLLLDGIDDHAVNTVIPAVTDYTYVVKRKGLIDKSDTAVAFKGNYKGGGGAFICDYTNPTEELTHVGWNFGARSSVIGSLKTDDIIWGTKTSVNGTTINPGINTDDVGLTVGKWNLYKNMVFYKMMLYTKTIDQLSINMLKNLFERDELIDVTNPIFKKDEL